MDLAAAEEDLAAVAEEDKEGVAEADLVAAEEVLVAAEEDEGVTDKGRGVALVYHDQQTTNTTMIRL